MIALWYFLFRTPDLTDLLFFVRTPFSIHQHGGLSSATDATRGAASALPTCSMRSVAAPRLNLNTPPFAVGVETQDPAVVGSEKSEKHGAHAAGSKFGYLPIPHSLSS